MLGIGLLHSRSAWRGGRQVPARRCLDGRAERFDDDRASAGAAGARLVALVEEGALGFAIATLARASSPAIGAGSRSTSASSSRTIFLPDVVSTCRSTRRLPSWPRPAAMASSAAARSSPRLEPNSALLVVAAWLGQCHGRDRAVHRAGGDHRLDRSAAATRSRLDARHPRAWSSSVRPPTARDDAITPRRRQTSLRAARLIGGNASRRISGNRRSQSRSALQRVGWEDCDDRHQPFGQGEAGHHRRSHPP
jgi:hypothetical protein